MRGVYLSLSLNELNVKCFFTDARKFKREGNTEMFNLAVKHIMWKRREMQSARRQIREYEARGCRPMTFEEFAETW